MESFKKPDLIHPPKLIESLTIGFNSVATNLHLILFPVLMDAFLWLGPHLRIKTLLEPSIKYLTSGAADFSTPEFGDFGVWVQEIWDIILTRFNLVSLVRSFPIGIPSLMAGISPINTPFGSSPIFEVNNVLLISFLWIVFSLIGIILGCLYFDSISRATDNKKQNFSFINAGQSTLQIIAFTLFFVLLLILFSIPILLIVSVLTLISPTLGEIALFFIGIIIIWLVIPLAFSPHGIFAKGESIINSINISIKLVRNYLPGSGLFFLIALLLYQGLNVLWETPPDTSWMTVIGIFGHAFISTGLIASSFVYYRGGVNWMESKQQQTAVQA